MSKVRVQSFGVSIDGYSAGPDQSLDNPLGVGGPELMLPHHARPPVEMKGGTTFHFVTGGIHAALEQAKAAAGERDVRIGGGVATIRQYLGAGLVDELHPAL